MQPSHSWRLRQCARQLIDLAMAEAAQSPPSRRRANISSTSTGRSRVTGRLRILEGLAQPREETEFALRYYNRLTSWVRIDGLLQTLHLTRDDLTQAPEKVAAAVRALAARVPTYVTIKDVKRRWGHGQEDVFPVAQFERLWGDLTFAARPSLRLSRRPPPAGTAAQGCGTA